MTKQLTEPELEELEMEIWEEATAESETAFGELKDIDGDPNKLNEFEAHRWKLCYEKLRVELLGENCEACKGMCIEIGNASFPCQVCKGTGKK